ncbi:uncharacterized protein LOC133292198 [Gastrolobium bilobum]|uniref:uncharacterized protein LOC133292198 n=1 Tax=Gastrolobium bilobum TaxID=150636 RepID=UPI002AAF4992|nr:uncharacterized protein LOC133292198 [Gastrolobium bilobum]
MSHDVLFEIFSCLPAKVVYRFKSVDIGQRYNGQKELHPLPGEELSSGVSNNVLQFLTNSARIVASSNGLILCRLLVSVEADLKIIFECDSDDCTLFLFFENPKDGWSSNLYCNVYLHKEGVWKAREESFTTGPRNLRFDILVIHNCFIHFISDCSPYVNRNDQYFWPYIMSYNLESGASRMLHVPKKARKGVDDVICNMGIFKWGKVTSSTKSICLVRLRKCVFTILALSDYESSSWRMILKVRVKAMGLMEQDPIVIGFTVLNGDLLVFATTKKVYGYGLSNENCMILEEICEHGCETRVCFTSYSNTLRTCGTDATTLPPKKKNATTKSNLEVGYNFAFDLVLVVQM